MTYRNATKLAATAALFLGLCACDDGASATGTAPSAKAITSASSGPKATAPKGDVFFLQPTNGATVFPEFEMAFGVKAIEIAARGAKDNKKGYIVVIVDGAPVPEGKTVPTDDKHLVFDKGTSGGTCSKLPKGKHKLTVQFVAGNGKSWGKKLSQTIEVEVIDDEGPRSVAFVGLEDGAKVKSPLLVKFAVKGMKIVPAGKDTNARTTGHHHVLIGLGATPAGIVIPADKTHVHFGKGQTEAKLELPKGKQKLTLQFADGAHNSFGPKMSATITVEVE